MPSKGSTVRQNRLVGMPDHKSGPQYFETSHPHFLDKGKEPEPVDIVGGPENHSVFSDSPHKMRQEE